MMNVRGCFGYQRPMGITQHTHTRIRSTNSRLYTIANNPRTSATDNIHPQCLQNKHGRARDKIAVRPETLHSQGEPYPRCPNAGSELEMFPGTQLSLKRLAKSSNISHPSPVSTMRLIQLRTKVAWTIRVLALALTGVGQDVTLSLT